MTPALNAGRFIARTLESVRNQRHIQIEHIVVDGGSTDETAALVSASGSARLVVVPGLRQADAVNRGVSEGRGEIIMILNADDIVYPDGIASLAAAMAADPHAGVAYADAAHIDENDIVIDSYPTRPFDADALIEGCYICQPASVVRRAAYEAIGGMNSALDYALDYDLWIRLARAGRFRKVEGVAAASRMHAANKTLAGRSSVFREVFSVLRTHYGFIPYSWSYAYASWLIYRNDGFFQQPPHSILSVLASLGVGLSLNPRHPRRAFGDWFHHRSLGRR